MRYRWQGVTLSKVTTSITALVERLASSNTCDERSPMVQKTSQRTARNGSEAEPLCDVVALGTQLQETLSSRLDFAKNLNNFVVKL